MIYDYTIIGAGIVGLATAYSLKKAKRKSKILVLEKETDVSMHQSGNNSGVIHSGVYYKPGSKKAINCAKGYKLLLNFLKEHKVPHEICGKIIVATNNKEIDYLNIIFQRGIKNGLKGLKILNQNQIKEYEPNVEGLRALHVPQAGITNYKSVSKKIYDLLKDEGVDFKFNQKITAIDNTKSRINVFSQNKKFHTKNLVNTAGLYSDKLLKLTGHKPKFKIIPFRGEYYNLKPKAFHLVNNLIYPVPDPDLPFLGVHFTRMINGGVESGPNAVFAYKREGYKKTDFDFFEFFNSIFYKGFIIFGLKNLKIGLYEIYRSLSKKAYLKSLQKLIPMIKLDDIEVGNSGVRAQAISNDGEIIDDFLIINSNGVVNVCNAPSPAATSCFAIGDEIKDIILKN